MKVQSLMLLFNDIIQPGAEISFIFSYQPNVMIWEREEEAAQRSPEQLGWDYTFSIELITVIIRSSVYQPTSHAHLGDYHFSNLISHKRGLLPVASPSQAPCL